MAWDSVLLRDDTESLVSLDNSFPYLSSLLRVPSLHATLASARLQNLLATRKVERDCPISFSTLPYHVVLDPVNICNLECPLCVQATDPEGRSRTIVNQESFRDLLSSIASHTIRLDLFNWGEPLLHPMFPELVHAVSDLGIFSRTSTNYSFRQPPAPESIVESGLNYLVVSIDGATQETYERYRVKGDLSNVFRNLKALIQTRDQLRKKTPLVEWQYLVFSHNVDEIDKALELAQDFGVDVFRYGGARGQMSSKIHVDSCTNVSQSGDVLLDPSHPLSEYDAASQKLRANERDGCRWLWGKVALHPDGGVAPCWSSWFEKDDFGNWRTEGLDKVWQGERFRRARVLALSRRMSESEDIVCGKCAYNSSFVPTPDGDTEAVPDLWILRQCANSMRKAGISPDPQTFLALNNVLTERNLLESRKSM